MISPRGFERLIEIQRESPTQAWCPKCSRAIDLDGQPASARARCVDCGTSVEPEPERSVGKYRIVREIAHGGMGIVYEAEDPDLRRRVALKILRDSDDETIQRLHREAAIAAQLQHPNIVAVHEVGMVRGPDERPIHFIAMDYVEGGTMAEMPAADRLRALEEVARAVHYAHDKGVVHRDLKPSNVLVDATGCVRLADFGLARADAFKTRLTASFAVMGTPSYMSPEQVRGERVGPGSDVYSLGVMLYEHLAGVLPFAGEGAPSVMQGILNDDPPPPPKRVPRDLQVICMKAMAREPGRRYASAEALADDLRRHRDGEPISARPPSLAYRFTRAVRRHPAVSAAAVVAAVSAVAFGLYAYQASKKQAALRELSGLWHEVVLAREGIYRHGVSPAQVGEALLAGEAKASAFIEANPEMPQAWYVRGWARLHLGRIDGAAADLETAVRLDEDFSPGWALLGRIRLEAYQRGLVGAFDERQQEEVRKRSEPALDAVREAIERARSGASVTAWGLGETEDDRIADVMHRALTLEYVRKDGAGAYRLLQAAHKERASAAFAVHLASLTRDHEERFNLLEEATRLAPNWERPYFERGVRHIDHRQFDDAVADFDRALQIDPDSAAALSNRGIAHAKAGRPDAAVADFDVAIRLRPDDAHGYINRGQTLEDLKHFDEALADFARALELNPNSASAHGGRGVTLKNMGRYDEAVADYRAAIRIDPTFGEAYHNMGIALRHLERYAESIDAHTKAIALMPGVGAPW